MEKNKRSLTLGQKAGLALCIALPLFLIVLPKDYFNEGSAKCFSVIFFDMECLGCGMTRAIMHLMHLDFSSAWEFNKLSFIVILLLILVWIHIVGRLSNKNWLGFMRSWY